MVPSGSRKGCWASLPHVAAFCSIIFSSALLVPARVPGLVSLLFFSFLSQEEDCVPSRFSGSFWFRARVPRLVSLLFFRFFLKNGSPNDFFDCAWTSRKYGLLLFGVYAGVIFSGKGLCSIMISWFLLVPAGVPGLVFLLSLFSFVGKGIVGGREHSQNCRSPSWKNGYLCLGSGAILKSCLGFRWFPKQNKFPSLGQVQMKELAGRRLVDPKEETSPKSSWVFLLFGGPNSTFFWGNWVNSFSLQLARSFKASTSA